MAFSLKGRMLAWLFSRGKIISTVAAFALEHLDDMTDKLGAWVAEKTGDPNVGDLANEVIDAAALQAVLLALAAGDFTLSDKLDAEIRKRALYSKRLAARKALELAAEKSALYLRKLDEMWDVPFLSDAQEAHLAEMGAAFIRERSSELLVWIDENL